jgi:REP element-mobilizing transposase RayT
MPNMPQSFCAGFMHIVFSTKDRVNFLLDHDLRSKVHLDLVGVSRRLECPVIEIGGVGDHVHMLIQQSPKISIAEYIREIKSKTSPMARTYHGSLCDFRWQLGYGAFSVDYQGLAGVRKYIQGQEKHHSAVGFQEEFLSILREHDLTWDERYIWD